MKRTIVILILLKLLSATNALSQVAEDGDKIDSLIGANPITDVRAILDSFEVIKKVGGIVDGYNYPPTAEEIRLNRIAGYMFKLPFAEAEKLLDDKNTVTKTHAFLVLLKRYPKKITKKHLAIFNDETKLYHYTSSGVIHLQMTVGEYCKMAYESEMQEADNR